MDFWKNSNEENSIISDTQNPIKKLVHIFKYCTHMLTMKNETVFNHFKLKNVLKSNILPFFTNKIINICKLISEH
jgi:hypothetical protein